MGTADKAKKKAKAKVAKKVEAKKAKTKRKAGKRALVAALAFALAFLCGCATSEAMQPAKSMTQNNSFEDCTIIIASRARLPIAGTNAVIAAEGGELPTLELFTQTQSLESSGTESFAPTATQTPTTDVKPDLDVHYNDAISAASATSKGILETLSQSGVEKVLSLMSSGGSGSVTVEKKDGTSAVVTCENGQCTTCTDCTVSK